MGIFGAAQRFVAILLVVVATYTGWIFLSRYLAAHRTAGPPHEDTAWARNFDRTYGGSDVRILQFYARDGVVTEGSGTVICYGVVNARSVRMEPATDGVGVALNRCVDAAPQHDTRYTLTAEGNDGKTVTASFNLQVKPDAAELPRITYFHVAKDRVEQGQHIYLVTFGQQNGQEITIDPPEFPTLHGAPFGQFYVAPKQTTTYTLTVTGKRGHSTRRQLTLEIPR